MRAKGVFITLRRKRLNPRRIHTFQVSHWIGHPNFEMVRHDVIEPFMIEVDRELRKTALDSALTNARHRR
jgi:hypothetical protein